MFSQCQLDVIVVLSFEPVELVVLQVALILSEATVRIEQDNADVVLRDMSESNRAELFDWLSTGM